MEAACPARTLGVDQHLLGSLGNLTWHFSCRGSSRTGAARTWPGASGVAVRRRRTHYGRAELEAPKSARAAAGLNGLDVRSERLKLYME